MKFRLITILIILAIPALSNAQHPCDVINNSPVEGTIEINKPVTIVFCKKEEPFITFKWYRDGVKDNTVLQPLSGTSSPITGQVQYFINSWIETKIGKVVLELVAINQEGTESDKSNPLSLTVRQAPPIAPTVISVTQ